MKTFIGSYKRTILAIIGVIVFICIWLIASNIINNPIILPKIKEVFKSLWDLFKQARTYWIMFNTLAKLILTVLVSLILAIIVAMISIASNTFYEIIKPTVTLMRTVPIASIIIILLIIFGSAVSPIVITAFVTFPLMYEAIYGGFKSIDKNILEEVKMISKLNKMVIFKVYLPLAMPSILTSILQSIGLGLKVMVMAELLSQPKNSIGKELLYQKEMLEMANVFAWTLIIIILALIIEFIVRRTRILNLKIN